MIKQFHILTVLIFITGSLAIHGQCFQDRHSTNWYDGWVSCEPSPNPISSYGSTHWILYDLGYDYVLNETKIWNANEVKHLDYGINEYTIDYSLDGFTWDNLGSFTMDRASGSSTYEGAEGPDFEGTKARYVLITPNTNYGGDCMAMSEIKIAITDPFIVVEEEDGYNASIYPNPFQSDINLRIVALEQNTPVSYHLYDIMGRSITSNNIDLAENQQNYRLPINAGVLSLGIYILKINQNGKEKTFKLIKRK
ncbi:T9SS type A sorting domain-containing protein [Hyunsoonleella rubra]|uniref:T9SS type A sorting domain-containing protein n=1 Tax=Hyunsoonleella rubra TaxID=1737062 RepID=A0ABW5TAU0_9FLAO